MILDTGKQTIASIDKNTEGVNVMKSELERVLLEIAAMSEDMQALTISVDRAAKLATDLQGAVATKVIEYSVRFDELETSVKNLKSKPVNDEPIEKGKPNEL